MPFVSADLTTLDNAAKQNLSMVRFQDGREMRWNSVDDYMKLRALIVNELATQGGTPQVRQVRVITGSGFGC